MLDIVPPRGGYERLDHSETLAVWLQRAGYATVQLGKYLNHYGRRDPTRGPAGWTEWHGLVDPSTYSYYGYVINDDGVLTRYGASRRLPDRRASPERAEEIIARRAAAPEPFFLWVGYLAPHNGLPREPRRPAGMPTPVAAPRHAGAFAGDDASRARRLQRGRRARQAARDPAPRRGCRGRSERPIDAHYRQELESLLAVDEGVDRIVEALRRSGELEDTLIVFTSDNGFMHGEHRVADRQGAALRALDPRAAADARPGRAARRGARPARGQRRPRADDPRGGRRDRAVDARRRLAVRLPARPGPQTGRDILIEGPARRRGGLRFTGLRSRATCTSSATRASGSSTTSE